MRIVKAKPTTLKAPLSAADTTVTLKALVDSKGNTIAMSAFQDEGVVVLKQGDTTEMIKFTGVTQNADGTATLTVASSGRNLDAVYPYTGAATGEDFNAGAVAIISNDPYTLWKITEDYVNGIALAGAPDASTTVKGVVETATLAQVRARTATGETGAKLAVTPDVLDDLPTQAQKTFLNAIPGIILPYGGATAPTGFLLCDGTAYNNADYSDLALVIRNYYGNDAGVAVTADAGTDLLTANSHGLDAGDQIFFTNVGGALPAGLSVNTPYYLRTVTTNTFKVATSLGGEAVDITGAGTGTHYFHVQFKVPDLRGSVFLGQGTRVRTMTFDGASSVDPSNDQITVASNDWLHTGQAVALTGSALPTGLSATTYYVIRVNATTIKLATSVANANEGTAVDITADGSGVCTLTQTLTARTVGQTGGEETHALTDAELASHTHQEYSRSDGSFSMYYFSVTNDTNGANGPSTIGNGYALYPTGSDTPHNTMPPYTVGSYIISV